MKSGPLREYFEDAIEVGYVFCKLCKTKLRNERLSNLKRHLRTMHLVHIDSTNKKTKQRKEAKIRNEKSMKDDNSLNNVLRSFLGLVTEDNVPFTVLNSQNLRTLLEPICKSVYKRTGKMIQLNADACKNALEIEAEEIRKQIKMELKHKLVSIKLTSCCDLSQKTYVVSGSVYNELGVKSSLILGIIKPMEFEKNATNLTEEIIAILYKNDIDLKQVVALTLDNVGDISLSSIITPESETEDIQISPCLATIAHMCCEDVINNVEFKIYLDICRNITRFVENSTLCRKYLEMDSLSVPKLDCQSRWGSTYEMVCAIKEAKKYLGDSFVAETDLPLAFWDFVDGFVEAMGPLQRSITRYKEEIHYSDFYAQWLKCKLSTECITKNNDSDEKNFAYNIGNLILESMKSRENFNKCLYSCLYLDPRFHRTLNNIQKTEARGFLKHLWDKLIQINPVDNVIENDVKPVIKTEIEDHLLDSFLCDSINLEPAVDSVTAYSKIDCLKLPFMKSDTDVLKFWESKKHIDSELYQLSEICFSIPPTQTMATSVLATFNQITETYRDCTKDTWENILLVRLNSSHLKQNVMKSFSLLENTIDDTASMCYVRLSVLEGETNSSEDIIENNCDHSENYDAENITLHNPINVRSNEIFEGVEGTQLKMEFYEGSDSIANCESTDDPLLDPRDKKRTSRRLPRANNAASISAKQKQEFLCVECGNKFTALHSLKTHMLRHMGDKKYQCPLCPKSFVNTSSLKSHLKIHSSEKPYTCDICSRGFNSKHKLRHHSRSHTGEKKFQCKNCDMRFRTRENLRRHMLSHTGEKPFCCKYCDRSFSQSNDRNKHLKKHLGANIFQCDFCPLRFPLLRDLRAHFAMHKDEDEETRAKNLEAREEEERNLKMQFSLLQ